MLHGAKGTFLMSAHLSLISGTYVWFWSIIKLGLIHEYLGVIFMFGNQT